ncbi:MAG: NrsF family protein [Ferrovibrio sp.]
MKTDDLIRAIAEDATPAGLHPQRRLAFALAGAVAAAAILFWILLGPRANALESLTEPRFLLKFFVTIGFAGAAIGLVLRMIRPGAAPGVWRSAIMLAPGLLLIGVSGELLALPSSSWMTALIGTNSRLCLTFIPLMGLAPLGLILLALRSGAPTRPALTGAVAGLIAGSISAAFYASHCPDDSPLFIAVWYTLAISMLMALGALLGRRLLRW